MSGKSIISNSYLEDIGDAIRAKKDTEETYYPSQMGDAIRSIQGIVPTGSIDIDTNGSYDVTQYAEAVVDVPVHVITSLTVTEDGTYDAPQGVDGYNPVTVSTGIAELQAEYNSAVAASGCDPLTSGIVALTGQANAKTGQSDTTLSAAVGTLITGYGNAKDIVVDDNTNTLSPAIANMFFDKINGEIGKVYAAILKQPKTSIINQQPLGMIFAKYDASADCIGGMVRYNTSGATYRGYAVSNTYDARVSIGDIYTVLSI